MSPSESWYHKVWMTQGMGDSESGDPESGIQ